MKVKGQHYHSIWIDSSDPSIVKVIDQRYLPFSFQILELRTNNDVYTAIRNMTVRGAPLIGVTAAFGIYLALLNSRENHANQSITIIANKLKSARPTAVNLAMAVDRILHSIRKSHTLDEQINIALQTAISLKNEELENSRKIGIYGLPLIENMAGRKKDRLVNILTHCNAGWLACIDWGTATAPIYMAHNKGINLHVWVDETRPRNQGARLTAWELGEHGVPHTLITDNTGGQLMQEGLVDMVIVGSDRMTPDGDFANKIGTYLKALAAKDNNVPFYVALPSTSIDWKLKNATQIPIEKRDPEEVLYVKGWYDNHSADIRIAPEGTPALNYGFDITSARFVTGLITERGTCKANRDDILKLFSASRRME